MRWWWWWRRRRRQRQSPSKLARGARNRPRMSLPPSSSQTRSTRQHNPNRRGNQNVHLLFAVAGELLSRGKKQAELSAISCFLGLAPSFLRGGPGRFVLVPSCSSAPLSGGLCRPRRNAARDPRGLSSEAPPTFSAQGGSLGRPADPGLLFCSSPARGWLSVSRFLAEEHRPHQRRPPALSDTPERTPVSESPNRGSPKGVPAIMLFQLCSPRPVCCGSDSSSTKYLIGL